MTDDTDALVLDFVEWVAAQPRMYTEVMEVWHTSRPRLTIWEDALDRGFVRRDHQAGTGVFVRATSQGLAWLAERGRREGATGR